VPPHVRRSVRCSGVREFWLPLIGRDHMTNICGSVVVVHPCVSLLGTATSTPNSAPLKQPHPPPLPPHLSPPHALHSLCGGIAFWGVR
jgi:hypothetical protein